jgi:hypothetical protein
MDTNHFFSHSILCKKQNDSMVFSVEQHFSALGLNLFGGGFHRLVHRMMPADWPKVPFSIEIDGKQFDSRFHRVAIEKVRNLRFRFLRREHRTLENWYRLSNLYNDIVSGVLVNVDGKCFGRYIGNASGQGCTTPDNTFKSFMDFVVLYLLLTPEEFHTYESFMTLIRLCICGDDMNVSVHPILHQYINPSSLATAAKDIGMEYTFASTKWEYFYDLSFLGHSFRKVEVPHLHSEMYLPIPDCERMRTSMLVFNRAEDKGGQEQIAMTIIRANGLRAETFACESCRVWFADLISFLRGRHGKSVAPCVKEAWSTYRSDSELWNQYTGLVPECGHRHGALETRSL